MQSRLMFFNDISIINYNNIGVQDKVQEKECWTQMKAVFQNGFTPPSADLHSQTTNTR